MPTCSRRWRTAARRWQFRRRLALAAFSRVAAYDAAISRWLAAETGETPRNRTVSGRLIQVLRHGENPHQQGGLLPERQPARRHHGAAGAGARAQLQQHLRHRRGDRGGGRARGARLRHRQARQPLRRGDGGDAGSRPTAAAFDCDRTSAFGGIVALNRPVDRATAEAITSIFTEVVIAPGADADAERVFAGAAQPAAADDRPDARPARAADHRAGRWRAGCWCRTATTAWRRRGTCAP